MSKHIFVKFGDSIRGEAEDADHKGWCEIYELSWELENEVSPPDKENAKENEHERGEMMEITIKKKIDRASTELANLCWKGHHLAEVVIECHRAGGTAPLKYLEIKLQHVVITNYEIGLSEGDDDMPEEELDLAFSYILMTYFPMDKTTGAATGRVTVEMDTTAG